MYVYLNRYFATEMLAFNAIPLASEQMDHFLSLYYSVAIKQIAKQEMQISSKSIMMIWLLFFLNTLLLQNFNWITLSRSSTSFEPNCSEK